MKARIISLTESKMVRVMIRRNCRLETLDLSENERIAHDFRLGDQVEVKREVNNPYLVVIGKFV